MHHHRFKHFAEQAASNYSNYSQFSSNSSRASYRVSFVTSTSDGVSNRQPHHCLLNRLFRRRSKKISKLRVTGVCAGIHRGPVNSPHKWRLKSPASPLFTQPFIQTQIKENIKAPRHWRLCGDSPGTGEFPAQMASNAENVSIWWRHHE